MSDHYETLKLALYQKYLGRVRTWDVKVKGQGHSDLKYNFLVYTLTCANIVRSLQNFQISIVPILSWMSLNMGYQGQMSRSLWPDEGLSFYIVLASSNNVRTWPDFSYSFILFTKFKLQKVPKVMVTDLLYDFHVYCLKSEEICFKCIFLHTYNLIAIISHIIVAYFMRKCI